MMLSSMESICGALIDFTRVLVTFGVIVDEYSSKGQLSLWCFRAFANYWNPAPKRNSG